jgi:hypothetical protein
LGTNAILLYVLSSLNASAGRRDHQGLAHDFPNASCAVAPIDRLTHHAEILNRSVTGAARRIRERIVLHISRSVPIERRF